jgi:phosphonate transport system permease protein
MESSTVAPPLVSPSLPPKPSGSHTRLYWMLAGIFVVALLVASWIAVQGSISSLVHGLFASNGLFRRFVPASVPPTAGQLWPGLKAAWTTLAIAVLSIFFGVFFSLLTLPLAARNIAPSRPVYELTRFLLSVLRSIPELIMLLMFNVVLGFSPFSAALALTLHGIGVMGKLFGEAVEEMDMTPVDALRVAGAGRGQVFLHAVLPGVRSTLVGLTFYRLDANFRSAVTLGAVGGGGIGFLIDNQLNTFAFKDVTAYLIVLVVVVMAVERVSTVLRTRFER